jgi:phosphoribosylformylglycinamidine synthase
VYEQYDSMVGTANISTNYPSDAGIVNVKNTNKALAMSVDCNSRYVNANPKQGTAMAVAEAARNIVVSGGEPSAITNCLNFGNPHNPESYWQFVGAIKGMTEACEKFSTPVTGGNVSFYNQSVIDNKEVPVFPTPTIGMLGIIEDKSNITSLNFKNKGDLIFMIGKVVEDISSSEYLNSYLKISASPAPYFNLDEEYEMQNIISKLIKEKVVNSAHDCADGGLFITLTEMAMASNLGYDVITSSEIREDAFLFGESAGRVVITIERDKEDDFIDVMSSSDVPFILLGHVTRGKVVIDEDNYGFISDLKDQFDTALANKLT